MPELFFNKFPVISYANTNCIDITKRVVIDSTLRNNPIAYDEYTLKNSTRADTIAENYYDDPAMEWMLFLVNGIVDPYYGWNLSSFDFNEHLIKKYGSVEFATQKISHYENNYKNDVGEISVDYYENTIAEKLKRYYAPNYDENIMIMNYSRRQDDVIVNTNKIYQFGITLSGNTNFDMGELVETNPGDGKGEVIFANTTYVKIKNVSGDLSSSITTIIGSNSGAQGTITSNELLIENISNDEAVFWTPVTYYDVENTINENNKNIKLMNPAYASEIAYNMRTVFKS
jgi:hypothetical protein